MIDRARKGGFRFRNIDELAKLHIAAANAFPVTVLATGGALPVVLERQLFNHKEAPKLNLDSLEKAHSNEDRKSSADSV